MTDAPDQIWIPSESKNHLSELQELEEKPDSDVLPAFTEYLARSYHDAILAETLDVAWRAAFRACKAPEAGYKDENSRLAARIERELRLEVAKAVKSLTPSDALAAREARDKRVRDGALREGRSVKVKPLDLSNLLKDAFLSGRATAGGSCVGDTEAWVEYDPTENAAYARILSALSPAPVSVDPLEVAELQSRLAQLEADNAAATTWGAAVGARQESIKAIRKRLRAISNEEAPAPVSVGEEVREKVAQAIAGKDPLYEEVGLVEKHWHMADAAIRALSEGDHRTEPARP